MKKKERLQMLARKNPAAKPSLTPEDWKAVRVEGLFSHQGKVSQAGCKASLPPATSLIMP